MNNTNAFLDREIRWQEVQALANADAVTGFFEANPMPA